MGHDARYCAAVLFAAIHRLFSGVLLRDVFRPAFLHLLCNVRDSTLLIKSYPRPNRRNILNTLFMTKKAKTIPYFRSLHKACLHFLLLAQIRFVTIGLILPVSTIFIFSRPLLNYQKTRWSPEYMKPPKDLPAQLCRWPISFPRRKETKRWGWLNDKLSGGGQTNGFNSPGGLIVRINLVVLPAL